MLRYARAFALLVTMLAAAPAAQAGPLDTVYADGTFTISQPVVVPAGATMTIERATVYLDFPTVCPTSGSIGYCQPQILVGAGGTLKIVDSTIDTRNWNPILSTSGYAIVTIGGRLEVTRSTLRHPRIVGGQGAGASATVTESRLVDGAQGLSFIRGMTALVEGNTFEDLQYGVSVHDGTSVVRNNTFRRISRSFSNGPVFGRAIDVQATLVGEKAFENLTTVTGNVVEDSHQALLSLNAFPNRIEDNTFRRNVIGSTIGLIVGDDVLHSAQPIYTDNILEGNATALTVYTSGTSRAPRSVELAVHGNALVGTICTDIHVIGAAPGISLTVDATLNWWGAPTGPASRGPSCPATIGNVSTAPWLTAPPA